MEYTYLNDALLMLLTTVAVVVLVLRAGLPLLLGYFAVGVVLGPYGVALVSDVEHITTFAEFGLVFLLFTIGLEFSVALLMRMKAAVLGLGSAQVLLTAALTSGAALAMGLSFESALVLGGVVAMSSTALVTKQLADQVELHTRHGRNSIGVLLFQDVMVVPFLILVAMFSGDMRFPSGITVLVAMVEGVAALLLIFVFGRWVLRPLFREVARFRSAELFTLTVLLLVLCSAWLTHQIGLTFVLGAFLAGVMLSETEFKHQVSSEIRPFRDVLLGLFFITIGMMLNVAALPEIWLSVVLVLAVLIVVKLSLVAVFCRLGGENAEVAMRTGLVLAHGGEFGFAILILAMNGGVLEPAEGQLMLAVMFFSMALAPFMIRFNGKLAALLLSGTVKKHRQEIKDNLRKQSAALSQHVIVCGYGRVGRHTMTLLSDQNIPSMAIDLEPECVLLGEQRQQSVSFGDASSLELLHACALSRASALVVSMIDFNTSMKIIEQVRAEDAALPIIVRTRKEIDLFRLYQAGATEVVADSFGSDQMISIELLQRLGLQKPV
ncbi:MAG: cation:proton antiporter [Mariprofundus sp.]|nr:cation:proton antiporter [Mariprofundus sp.]